jgi:DNA-binding transcriptional regulator YiaG
MYHFTDGGLSNVWLKNGFAEHKTPYGDGVSFHDLDGLVIAICLALCKKPGKLTGAEFRYIRNALLMSQKSLGQLFGYTEQAVAKWEKFGKVPKVVDAALRLVFVARHDGTQQVNAAVDMLNIIDRMASSRIIVSESKSKWISNIEELNTVATQEVAHTLKCTAKNAEQTKAREAV